MGDRDFSNLEHLQTLGPVKYLEDIAVFKSHQVLACMATAHVFKELSRSSQLKVGCAIGSSGRVVSTGYNGTEPGAHNSPKDANGEDTKDFIHAEVNATKFFIEMLNDADSSGHSDCHTHNLRYEVVFVTTPPCKACAEFLSVYKPLAVVYDGCYKTLEGLNILESAGIPTIKFSDYQDELEKLNAKQNPTGQPGPTEWLPSGKTGSNPDHSQRPDPDQASVGTVPTDDCGCSASRLL